MPHYKNGRPAKVGDLVLNTPTYPGTTSTMGFITNVQPGDACNGGLMPIARRLPNGQWLPYGNAYDHTVTLKECMLMTEETMGTTTAETEREAVGAGT